MSARLVLAAVIMTLAGLPGWGPPPGRRAADKVRPDCTFRGTKLWGRVQVVSAFPDYKIKMVDAFADLHVKAVEAFPDACGRWQYVDAFPDFKVQVVDAFPDFTIKMVEAFPGTPP